MGAATAGGKDEAWLARRYPANPMPATGAAANRMARTEGRRWCGGLPPAVARPGTGRGRMGRTGSVASSPGPGRAGSPPMLIPRLPSGTAQRASRREVPTVMAAPARLRQPLKCPEAEPRPEDHSEPELHRALDRLECWPPSWLSKVTTDPSAEGNVRLDGRAPFEGLGLPGALP